MHSVIHAVALYAFPPLHPKPKLDDHSQLIKEDIQAFGPAE